jgi:hypothetical protein
MTAVCSVGLDMIAIPGDTPEETIAAIIADEAAIGVFNHKDDRGEDYTGSGKEGRRLCRIRRPARPGPGDGGEQLLGRKIYPPRRPHPRPDPQPAQLTFAYFELGDYEAVEG